MARRRRRSSGLRMFLAGLVFGMAILLLVSDPFVLQRTLNDQEGTTEHTDPIGNDTLYIDRADTAYLNRIFRERSHEVAYCGIVIDGERRRIEPWLADTLNASPHGVRFSTDNCPGDLGTLLATIHTHPSGNPTLSDRDRATLAVSKERVMCIQAGTVTARPPTVAENLVCYRDAQLNGKVQISRVPVVITEQPDQGDTWE